MFLFCGSRSCVFVSGFAREKKGMNQMDDRKKKQKDILSREGSFTVETALVMIPVLGVICAILFAGFFLHDRCVLAGAAYETAVWGAHRERLEDPGVNLALAAESFAGGKTIAATVTGGGGSVGRGSVHGEVTASIRIPGTAVLTRLLHTHSYELHAQADCPCPDREEIIRTTRELMALGKK